ncbi:MAG: anti-sigma factor family protein, partial [Candidatus Aminicenantales bacterium]
AQRMISDYIDGDLDKKRGSVLERHIQRCPDCQKFLEDLRGILKDAHGMEKVSPTEKTWHRIKARLEAETPAAPFVSPGRRKGRSFPVFQPRLKLALSVALIFVVVFLGVRYGKGIFGGMDPQQYTLSKLEEAEHHYQLAIKALAEAVSSRKEGLDPEVSRIFQTNLEIIDASIASCRKAVLAEPDSIEVRNYLLFAYSKKLDLLDKMAAVESASSPTGEATL